MVTKHRKKLYNKREKKQKSLSLFKIWKNNTFALKLIWETTPLYIVYYFLSSIIYSIIDFLSGVFLLRLIVNSVQEGKNPKQIIFYVLAILGLNFAINILNSLMSDIILADSTSKIASAIQKKLFAQAQRVELSCYEHPDFYDKYVRAMEGANGYVLNVMYTIDELIWRFVHLFGNAILIFTIDPIFIVFSLIPLLTGFLRKKNNAVNHTLDLETSTYRRKKSYIKRTFYLNDYAKEIRQTNISVRLIELFQDNLEDFKKIHNKFCFKQAGYGLAIKIGTQIITVLGATLYAIFHTIVTKKMLIGDCLIVITSIGDISSSLEGFVSKLTDLQKNALYLEDMQHFLSYEPKINENINGKIPTGGTLELKNVTFRYEGSNINALSNINLTIRTGERIALVGSNGSGKSTLIKLLLHLYEPTEGAITLNGDDWLEYNLGCWRRQFSTVFQDFHNFPYTVAQNVLLRPLKEGDDIIIEKALLASGVFSKIETLDDGINTILTKEFDDNGIILSGGESQKIALARAFVENDRPFVLLDEPSSALDPIAEYQMFENMLKLTRGKTVVFVSHRLSCVSKADRICLLEHGKLIEMGTHCELMNRNGKYAEMFKKQAETYVQQ